MIDHCTLEVYPVTLRHLWMINRTQVTELRRGPRQETSSMSRMPGMNGDQVRDHKQATDRPDDGWRGLGGGGMAIDDGTMSADGANCFID